MIKLLDQEHTDEAVNGMTRDCCGKVRGRSDESAPVRGRPGVYIPEASSLAQLFLTCNLQIIIHHNPLTYLARVPVCVMVNEAVPINCTLNRDYGSNALLRLSENRGFSRILDA